MIEVVYFVLFAIIVLFLVNVYLFFFKKPSTRVEQVFSKWKLSLFIFIISLVLFFLYFGMTFNLIQQTQTINMGDGSGLITVTNNNYLDALSFFQMVISVLLFNFLFLVANIFSEFQVFGRTRLKVRR